MKRKILSAILALLLTLTLAACNKVDSGNVDIPADQTASADFQKNMHQSTTSNLRYICETEDGIYFQNFFASLSNTEHLEICQNGCKKSSKSFSDLLLRLPLLGGEIFSCKVTAQ